MTDSSLSLIILIALGCVVAAIVGLGIYLQRTSPPLTHEEKEEQLDEMQVF